MDHTEEIDASDQSKIGDLIMLMHQSAENAEICSEPAPAAFAGVPQ
jgi:hypothetical protein